MTPSDDFEILYMGSFHWKMISHHISTPLVLWFHTYNIMNFGILDDFFYEPVISLWSYLPISHQKLTFFKKIVKLYVERNQIVKNWILKLTVASKEGALSKEVGDSANGHGFWVMKVKVLIS